MGLNLRNCWISRVWRVQHVVKHTLRRSEACMLQTDSFSKMRCSGKGLERDIGQPVRRSPLQGTREEVFKGRVDRIKGRNKERLLWT